MAAKPLPYLVGTSFRPRGRDMPVCAYSVPTCKDEKNYAVLTSILCLLATLKFKKSTSAKKDNGEVNKPAKKMRHRSTSQKERSRKSPVERNL
ncbi:hypothetical protein IFM47457_03505 [Aspergillus lentulus]|nr:hypothetical protein IFM47457_03505 [Aspergillus lentulus]